MFYQYKLYYKVLSQHLGREVLNSRQVEKETFSASDVEKISMKYHDEMVSQELKRDRIVLGLLSFIFGAAAVVFVFFISKVMS